MKCIIIHGCPTSKEEISTYDKHWISWTKKQLEERGFHVENPLMPEPWEPIYSDWKKEFEKIPIDEDTVLVGHSGGTTFLVRWLGESKKKIKKLILVAPWKLQWQDTKENREFCDFKIEPEIKKRVKQIIYF